MPLKLLLIILPHLIAESLLTAAYIACSCRGSNVRRRRSPPLLAAQARRIGSCLAFAKTLIIFLLFFLLSHAALRTFPVQRGTARWCSLRSVQAWAGDPARRPRRARTPRSLKASPLSGWDLNCRDAARAHHCCSLSPLALTSMMALSRARCPPPAPLGRAAASLAARPPARPRPHPRPPAPF